MCTIQSEDRNLLCVETHNAEVLPFLTKPVRAVAEMTARVSPDDSVNVYR
jgi:hypothetical protein